MLTALAVLDFDGATAQEIQTASQTLERSSGLSTTSNFVGFISELPVLNTQYGGYNAYNFLDLDHNGTINRTDGDLTINQIVARVRIDFQAYDVRVVREDNSARTLSLVNNGQPGDTLVLVSGYHSPTDMGYGGQSVVDSGNLHDDIAYAGGAVNIARRIVGANMTGQAALNAFYTANANVISHEIGHTFSLPHHDPSARTPRSA